MVSLAHRNRPAQFETDGAPAEDLGALHDMMEGTAGSGDGLQSRTAIMFQAAATRPHRSRQLSFTYACNICWMATRGAGARTAKQQEQNWNVSWTW